MFNKKNQINDLAQTQEEATLSPDQIDFDVQDAESIKNILYESGLVIFGSVMFSIAMNMFLLPAISCRPSMF